MNPYPFSEERTFTQEVKRLKWVTNGATMAAMYVLIVLAGGLSAALLAFVIGNVILLAYRRADDNPWKRARLTMIVGAALTLFTAAPIMVWRNLIDLAYSLGDQATTTPLHAATMWALFGAGPGILFGGLIGGAKSAQYSYETQAFLRVPRLTRSDEKRMHTNKELVANATKKRDDLVQFGVVKAEKMPWRACRYGMIVERPMKQLGHGLIVGSNGSGKTYATVNIACGVLGAGAGVLYVDNKDAKDTRDLLTKAAVKAGRPVVTLSMTDRENTTWFDPFLDDTFTPIEKASMTFQSLKFQTVGDAAFYAQTAQTWLQEQFKVLERIGRRPGEGTFDFLYRTSTPQGMEEALTEAGAMDAPFAQSVLAIIAHEGARNLSKELRNLRNQLKDVVTSAGHLLRPNAFTKPLDLRAAERDGAMVYVGLSGTADLNTMQMLASVVLRYVGLLVSQRLNQNNDTMRDAFVFVDEAGFLEERSSAFNGLYMQARAAKYWIWTVSQSLASFSEETNKQIMSNANTRVALRLNEEFTAKLISESTMRMYVIANISESSVTTNAFGSATVSASGDMRRQVAAQPHMLTPEDFLQLPDYHAYVLVNLSDVRSEGANQRDGAVMEKWRPAHPIGKRKYADENLGDAPMVLLVPLTLPSDSEVHAALNPLIASSFTDFIAAQHENTNEYDIDLEHAPLEASNARPATEQERAWANTLTASDTARPATPVNTAPQQNKNTTAVAHDFGIGTISDVDEPTDEAPVPDTETSDASRWWEQEPPADLAFDDTPRDARRAHTPPTFDVGGQPTSPARPVADVTKIGDQWGASEAPTQQVPTRPARAKVRAASPARPKTAPRRAAGPAAPASAITPARAQSEATRHLSGDSADEFE